MPEPTNPDLRPPPSRWFGGPRLQGYWIHSVGCADTAVTTVLHWTPSSEASRIKSFRIDTQLLARQVRYLPSAAARMACDTCRAGIAMSEGCGQMVAVRLAQACPCNDPCVWRLSAVRGCLMCQAIDQSGWRCDW